MDNFLTFIWNFDLNNLFFRLPSDDVTMSGIEKLSRLSFLIQMFSVSQRTSLVQCVQNGHKKKA